MNIYIGIDDTDNKDSRGTGFHSRQLASELEKTFEISVLGITRHQQLVHPDVPYTSQNSSACLVVSDTPVDKLIYFCKQYLIKNQVPGCDIGLCVIKEHKISKEIISFARKVKQEVVTQQMARNIAEENHTFLEGLCGTEDGVIGALAAVGLRKSGCDGRFIWLNGPVKELRELPQDVMSLDELLRISGIHHAETANGEIVSHNPDVLLSQWVRPILKDGRPVVVLSKTQNNNSYEWETAGKDIVRKLSD